MEKNMFNYKDFEQKLMQELEEKLNKLLEKNKDAYIVSLVCDSDLHSMRICLNSWNYLKTQKTQEDDGYFIYKYFEEKWKVKEPIKEISTYLGKFMKFDEGDEEPHGYICESLEKVLSVMKEAYPYLLFIFDITEYASLDERAEWFESLNGEESVQEYLNFANDNWHLATNNYELKKDIICATKIYYKIFVSFMFFLFLLSIIVRYVLKFKVLFAREPSSCIFAGAFFLLAGSFIFYFNLKFFYEWKKCRHGKFYVKTVKFKGYSVRIENSSKEIEMEISYRGQSQKIINKCQRFVKGELWELEDHEITVATLQPYTDEIRRWNQEAVILKHVYSEFR